MPIKRSKQSWTIGQTVKVGFMSLTVTGFEPTPGDYRPDRYILKSAKGTRYTFTPHFGLERIAGEPIELALDTVSNTPAPVFDARRFVDIITHFLEVTA